VRDASFLPRLSLPRHAVTVPFLVCSLHGRLQGVPFLMRRYMHRKHSPFTGSLRQSMIDVVALAAAAVGNSVTDAPPSTVKRGWFANARHSTCVPYGLDAEGFMGYLCREAGLGCILGAYGIMSQACGCSLKHIVPCKLLLRHLLCATSRQVLALDLNFLSFPPCLMTMWSPVPAESSETVAQELSLVLHTMTQIYIHKLKADKEDDKSSRSHLPLVRGYSRVRTRVFGVAV
jgi:hypothetical protein